MIIIINKCLPASTPAPEQLPLACKILYVDIVDMERFTGLKFMVSTQLKFSGDTFTLPWPEVLIFMGRLSQYS